MKTPDVTPVAVGAALIVAWTNGLILFGLNISPRKEAALETLLNGTAGLGFLLHDAIVRHGRARKEAARLEADSRLATAHVYAKARAHK